MPRGFEPPSSRRCALLKDRRSSRARRQVEEATTLGFGALALFVRLGDTSLTQPIGADETSIALNVGAFQLPLHLGSELALARKGVTVNELAVAHEPRL